MRALVFDSSLRYDAHRPTPPEALGDTLVRVHQAGVCSTDLEITSFYMKYHVVL